jgi:hypothetical protein
VGNKGKTLRVSRRFGAKEWNVLKRENNRWVVVSKNDSKQKAMYQLACLRCHAYPKKNYKKNYVTERNVGFHLTF